MISFEDLRYSPPPISVAQSYAGVPAIPAGYYVVSFRPPKYGENYLDSTRDVNIALWDFVDRPRLILQKEVPKKFLLVETGEYRPVRNLEFFVSAFGDPAQWTDPLRSSSAYKILKVENVA